MLLSPATCTGTFHSMLSSSLNFPKFLVTNSIFRGIPKLFPECSSEWFPCRKFINSEFLGNLRTICSRSEISGCFVQWKSPTLLAPSLLKHGIIIDQFRILHSSARLSPRPSRSVDFGDVSQTNDPGPRDRKRMTEAKY